MDEQQPAQGCGQRGRNGKTRKQSKGMSPNDERGTGGADFDFAEFDDNRAEKRVQIALKCEKEFIRGCGLASSPAQTPPIIYCVVRTCGAGN